jgi:hypothetical protein
LQRWGIDIVGLLTAAQGNYKYAVVVVEYFTKWIEAKPLVNITAVGLKKFFWQNIICRFGVIRKIIINNAKQFDSTSSKNYVTKWESKQSSLQCITLNLIVRWKKADALIFTVVKKILKDQPKGKWA